MQEDAVLMVVSDKEKVLRKEDLEIFSTIRRITAKGNDVVVKRRKDGSLVAYEIKMSHNLQLFCCGFWLRFFLLSNQKNGMSG